MVVPRRHNAHGTLDSRLRPWRDREHRLREYHINVCRVPASSLVFLPPDASDLIGVSLAPPHSSALRHDVTLLLHLRPYSGASFLPRMQLC